MIQSETETAETPSSQDGAANAAKMDPAIKTAWATALRSDKYQQGQGSLVRQLSDGHTQFCCLGVLCDVHGAVWESPRNIDDGRLDGVEVRASGRSYLSVEILKRFGLTENQQLKLAQMNDEAMPFPEIADYIEANL